MATESFNNPDNRIGIDLLHSLGDKGFTVENDRLRVKGAYIFGYRIENGAVTMGILLQDSSGADLAITNMTTLPCTMKRQGFGTLALTQLLK